MKLACVFLVSILLVNAACVPGNPDPRQTPGRPPDNEPEIASIHARKGSSDLEEGSGGVEESSGEWEEPEISSGEGEIENASGDMLAMPGIFEASEEGSGDWPELMGGSGEGSGELSGLLKKLIKGDALESSGDSEEGSGDMLAMPNSLEVEEDEGSGETFGGIGERNEGSGDLPSVSPEGSGEVFDIVEKLGADDDKLEGGSGDMLAMPETLGEKDDEEGEDDAGGGGDGVDGSGEISVEEWSAGVPEEQFRAEERKSTTKAPFVPYWMQNNGDSDDLKGSGELAGSGDKDTTPTAAAARPSSPMPTWLAPKIKKILAGGASADEPSSEEDVEGSGDLEGSGNLEGSGVIEGSGELEPDVDGPSIEAEPEQTPPKPTTTTPESMTTPEPPTTTKDPNEPDEEWKEFFELVMKTIEIE